MSSPSTAKISASNRIARNTKRDVNASHSRAFGASSISNSSRKVNGTTQGGSGQSARVYLDGADVTPQSLLLSRIKPSSAQQQYRSGNKGKGGATRRSKNTHGGSSIMGASVILSSASMSSLDDSSDNDIPSGNNTAAVGNKSSGTATKASASAAAGASRVSAGTLATPAPVPSPSSGPHITGNQNDDDDAGGPENDKPGALSDPKQPTAATISTQTATSDRESALMTSATSASSSTTQGKPEKPRRRPITIQLVETPTMVVFELHSVCVSAESSSHSAVAARNRQYLEMCASKKGSDKFVEGRSQTLQLAQKGKEVMTAPPATRDVMCVATDWDIFDCARIEEDNQNEHDETGGMDAASTGTTTSAVANSKSARALSEYENGDQQLKHQVDEIVEATLVSPGCVLDVDGDIVEDLKARQHARTRRSKNARGTNSQKSRNYHASSSTQDLGRSSANLNAGNSSSSMASATQSGANLSFNASQDAVGGSADDSGTSIVQNSQVGMSTTSHGVLSADSSGDDNKQNPYARANANVDIGETIAQQRTAKVLGSQSLLKTVRIVERAVQQNVYHQQHVLYRNFPSLTDQSGIEKDIHQQLIGESGDWRSSIGASSTTSSGDGTRSGGLTSKGGVLEKLWAFRCKLTENRRVSCLAWNTVNEDLLAVSYSRAEDRPYRLSLPTNNDGGGVTGNVLGGTGGYSAPGSQPVVGGGVATANFPGAQSISSGPAGVSEEDGLILFWSLKNPEYPERVYNLGVGVMSIDFSHSQPYLLAVGFTNGVVAIFDTRKDDSVAMNDSGGARVNGLHGSFAGTSGVRQVPGMGGQTIRLHTPTPIATSEVSPGKHLDVLWQVKWISKGSDRGENVVSISSDGRVTEWSMKKGLSYSDLMTLKRIANPLLGSDSRADGVISRQASGHCIDFAKNDPSVYFVGTEDGLIHKCSVSYNEQYLQTYFGHTGPVYQILVSPFCNDFFLSCSGDWNIKLWHQSEQKDALNFRSVDLAHAVHGISWCPSNSTIFGAVSEDGRIEIWDLEQSILDPIITHFPKKYMPRTPASGAPGSIRPASIDLERGMDNIAIGFDALDDSLTPSSSVPGVNSKAASAIGGSGGEFALQPELNAQLLEIPLECTKIAFAPSAPIIVVGDSSGDVTVYRVPTLTESCTGGETLSSEEHVAKLLRAINPNKHE